MLGYLDLFISLGCANRLRIVTTMNSEMNHQFLIANFLNQKIEDVSSRGKNVNGLESGITGELAMLLIIEHHCGIVFNDLVMPSRKTGKVFAAEMDYVCVRNGNPIFVEVKNWFDRMKKPKIPAKLTFFVNTNGKFVRNLGNVLFTRQ